MPVRLPYMRTTNGRPYRFYSTLVPHRRGWTSSTARKPPSWREVAFAKQMTEGVNTQKLPQSRRFAARQLPHGGSLFSRNAKTATAISAVAVSCCKRKPPAVPGVPYSFQRSLASLMEGGGICGANDGGSKHAETPSVSPLCGSTAPSWREPFLPSQKQPPPSWRWLFFLLFSISAVFAPLFPFPAAAGQERSWWCH